MATSIPRGIGRLNQTDLSLNYEGKDEEFSASTVKPANLERVRRFGRNSPNRLVWSDNLCALSTLLADTRIAGKVQCIYIDPPFSTGGVFEDRSQKHAYADLQTGGEFLESLRQRFVLLRELLSPDGSIYVHLDEKSAFEAKILLDEVFGRKQFRNFIVRKKCNSKNYTRKRLGNIVDYILYYTKGKEFIWNRPVEPYTDEFIDREYPYFDAERGQRYKRVPLHAPGVRNGESGQRWRGMSPPPGKHWQYRPSTLEELDANGEIYWSRNGNPRRKVFLDHTKGNPIQDVWLDLKDPHNQNVSVTGYPTEKNLRLVERIVEASSEPGGLVLDAFGGSGTTAEAAFRQARNWICIDSNEAAVRATIERLLKGRKLMGDFVQNSFDQLEHSSPALTPGFELLVNISDYGFEATRSLAAYFDKLAATIPTIHESAVPRQSSA